MAKQCLTPVGKAAKSMGSGDWMQRAVPPSHKGALHRAMGIPEGQTIPTDRLEQAKDSDDPHMRRMAVLAATFKKMRGGG